MKHCNVQYTVMHCTCTWESPHYQYWALIHLVTLVPEYEFFSHFVTSNAFNFSIIHYIQMKFISKIFKILHLKGEIQFSCSTHTRKIHHKYECLITCRQSYAKAHSEKFSECFLKHLLTNHWVLLYHQHVENNSSNSVSTEVWRCCSEVNSNHALN